MNRRQDKGGNTEANQPWTQALGKSVWLSLLCPHRGLAGTGQGRRGPQPAPAFPMGAWHREPDPLRAGTTMGLKPAAPGPSPPGQQAAHRLPLADLLSGQHCTPPPTWAALLGPRLAVSTSQAGRCPLSPWFICTASSSLWVREGVQHSFTHLVHQCSLRPTTCFRPWKALGTGHGPWVLAAGAASTGRVQAQRRRRRSPRKEKPGRVAFAKGLISRVPGAGDTGAGERLRSHLPSSPEDTGNEREEAVCPIRADPR